VLVTDSQPFGELCLTAISLSPLWFFVLCFSFKRAYSSSLPDPVELLLALSSSCL